MTASLPLHVEPVAAATRDRETVATQAFVFRHGGVLHVTVMAKVVLELVQDGPMRFASDRPRFREGDVLDERGVARGASEARPLLRRTDVTFVGHAHAPAQNPARRMLVRFALVRPVAPGGPVEGGAVLFDKSLGIIGQRFATGADPNPFPGAFVRLPISYALSLGGPRDLQNPAGVGREPDPHGILALPSIVPAGEATVAAAPLGYGPIPKHWPARARLGVETRHDAITDLAPNLDFELFQAAPVDQRVDLLRGDEWVYLENLHPRSPRLLSRLPGIAAEARIDSGHDAVQRLPLRIDALHVLGDEGRVEITCSGALSVQNEAALAELTIGAAVTAEGEAVDWLPRRALPIDRPGRRPDFAGTLVIELPPGPPAPMRAATMVIEPELAAKAVEPASAIEEPPLTQVFSSSFERSRTTVVYPEGPPSTHAPFRLGKPRSRPNADAEPIPGAPWEEDGPVAVRPVTRPGIDGPESRAPHTESIADEAPASAPPAAVRAEPVALPPPPPRSVPSSRHATRKAGGDLWAKPDATAVMPPPVPKAKAVVPSPAVKKNTLYERFRKG